MKALFLTMFVFVTCSFFSQECTVKFFPKDYEEFVIDSTFLLDEPLRVIIVRRSLMDESVSFSYTMDNNQIEKHYYRDFSSEITVLKSDTIVFNQTFSKTDFKEIDDDEFLKKAIIHNTWVQSYDTNKKILKLSLVVGVPETDWDFHFILNIDSLGRYFYELESME